MHMDIFFCTMIYTQIHQVAKSIASSWCRCTGRTVHAELIVDGTCGWLQGLEMHFLLARISCGMLVRCCFSCKCNVDASHGCTCAHHESYIISMELLHSVTLRHLHIVSTVSPILISIVALSTCSALPSLSSRVYSQRALSVQHMGTWRLFAASVRVAHLLMTPSYRVALSIQPCILSTYIILC